MSQAQEPLFSAEQWHKLRASIDRVDALPANAREVELERIAAADPELARAMRDFADADAVPDELPPLAPAIAAANAMPAQVGSFHLLREIGVGGMGVVYLAERQGPDFTQRVALKLLDGGASRMARLAARERNILAALAHPNITAFVDAGMENGRAWLAMEYVDGEPLLVHCARLALDTRERVRLFDQVCAAVAHAHAQLVVHRDLKPSNVLVNRDGSVKLLDFGIALVLDPGDAKTPATQVFTPEYAAPEQLRGERVTTATDVYALGLLLYELLCGRRLPTLGHDNEWTTAELARFSTTQDNGDRSQATDAKTPVRALRGDLGRIVAHTLASEPTCRYQTVTSLREDLQRWLDHRPLGIGRPGLTYAATRFVRRHRAAVAVAAIAVLGLIATSVVALWQAHEARLMAARADHARSFLNALFLNADPYNAKHGAETMAGFLRDAGQRIDTEFADAPEMAILLRSTIASALLRLDQPKPAHALYLRNLDQTRALYGAQAPQVGETLSDLARSSEDSGDIDAARTEYEQAYALLRDAGEEYARGRVSVMTGLSAMAFRRSDYAQAQRWDEQVLRERQAHEGPQSPDIAMDLMNLSNLAMYRDHFAESETLALQAHTMLAQVLGADHPRMIYVDNALGVAQLYMGKCAAAVATLQHSVAVARRNLPPGAHMLGSNLANLGRAQACAGDDTAAMASLREGLSIFTAAHDPATGTVELRLGLVELHARSNDALRMLDASRTDLAAAAAHQAGSNVNALWAEAADGDARAIAGDVPSGERLARDARDKLLAGKNAGDSTLAEIDTLLADVLDRKPAPAEARTLRQEALSVFTRVYGADHPKTRALAAQLSTATAG
ncbi:MAG: serine/threonine protein kinase [Proteobacteria bacterium]|nr:serine/threonine protein kinase [Pseudomonadota bacterium]